MKRRTRKIIVDIFAVTCILGFSASVLTALFSFLLTPVALILSMPCALVAAYWGLCVAAAFEKWMLPTITVSEFHRGDY